MINEAVELVARFHEKAGQGAEHTPCQISNEKIQRRVCWITDELQELLNAKDVYEQADAITDLLYYLLGAYVDAGIKPDPLFQIIHQSNMKKVCDPSLLQRSEDGKIQKPHHWSHPDNAIRQAVDNQKKSNDSTVSCSGIYLGGYDAEKGIIYNSAVLFSLQQQPRKALCCTIDDWSVEIRQDVIVARSQYSYPCEGLIERAYTACEKALDLFDAQGHGAYLIVQPDHRNIAYYVQNSHRVLSFANIVELMMDMDVSTYITDKDGNRVQLPGQLPPDWDETFRFIRFSHTSNNVYDAYRWAYLAFECLMQKINPVELKENGKPAQKEKTWVEESLKKANSLYGWATIIEMRTEHPVDVFMRNQYDEIRCKLFHAKDRAIIPDEKIGIIEVEKAFQQLDAINQYLSTKVSGFQREFGGLTDQGFAMMMKEFGTEKRGFVSEELVNPAISTIQEPVLFLSREEAERRSAGLWAFHYGGEIQINQPFVIRSYGVASEEKEALITADLGEEGIHAEQIDRIEIHEYVRIRNRGDTKQYG